MKVQFTTEEKQVLKNRIKELNKKIIQLESENILYMKKRSFKPRIKR